MNELSALRQETNKTFELEPALGLGQYQLEARTGPIHYKEAYRDADPWLDLDETYREDRGDHWFYPKLPNTVKVFKDSCAYEIQNRSNPAHVMKVELMRVNGIDVSRWLDDADLSAYVKVHPYRVGIWKEFKRARASNWRFRWKVTETGRDDRAVHLMSFKEDIDAWSRVDPTNVDPDTVKVAVAGTRTRIDDNSWFWEEVVPRQAMLVDTDYSVGANVDDGIWTTEGAYNSGEARTILGCYNSGTHCNSWYRFTSLGISKDSTINSALVTFRAYADKSTVTCKSYVYANNVDNATGVPANASEGDALALTSEVSWTSAAWTSGNYYATPSLVTPVQAIINLSGWANGNAMMIVLKNNASSNTAYRFATAYETSTSTCAKLTVTWTEPTIYSGRGMGRGIGRGIMR